MSQKIPFQEAMRSQPRQLALAHTSLVRDLDAATLAAWKPGETVGIIAMGASNNSGHALVAVLAACGFRAVNLVASELLLAAPGYEPADHYVIVSESGRSPEPLDAARALGARAPASASATSRAPRSPRCSTSPSASAGSPIPASTRSATPPP